MYLFDHITAIVLAAGKGTRFGSEIPKQFNKVNGKEILEMSLASFDNNDWVDDIILVLDGKDPDFDEKAAKYITEFPSIRTVVPGGLERQDSVRNGIKYAVPGIVLIHDGARPFLKDDVIKRVIVEACKSGAAIPVVSPKDTIRRTNETLDRNTLYQVQTPQGFKLQPLSDAYLKAYNDGFKGTDDASIYEKYVGEVSLVQGDYENIKITTPDDLKEDKKIVSFRVGNGFDVHKLVKDRLLILGGVEIPYELGLLGHSDADVLTHAIMDSLLGALALGDIGRHFPDNDDRYLDISSLYLLNEVNNMIIKEGYEISNIDATVICEKPKIAMYIDDMKERLAGTLKIDKSQINIKGTTTEKLGFTGRGEGIAALSTALLVKKG